MASAGPNWAQLRQQTRNAESQVRRHALDAGPD
jgi:hypothetical protein